MNKPVKPGEKAPRSGQYEELGPRGGRTGHEVTISKGERVPPTRQPDLPPATVPVVKRERSSYVARRLSLA